METRLYMRVRGRVLGPYEPEKLQALVRRGQLSRLHELSTDGVSWERASNYPELFTTNVELPAQQAAESPADTNSTKTPASANGTSAPTNASAVAAPDFGSGTGLKWYYSRGGAQGGPVEFATLRSMSVNGQLSLDDLLWTEGMGDWQPAKTVGGFSWPPGSSVSAMGFPSTSHTQDDRRSLLSNELTESLTRAAVGSRGWVLFVSIVMFLAAGLSAIGGIGLMVQGARVNESKSVTGGIFSLLTAIVIAVGGFLLISYGSRLAGLRYSREPILLERALDTLRIFWLYVGICLIVWLVFLVILIISGAAMLS